MKIILISIRQIAYADVVLINKVDLVSEEDTAKLMATVRTVNPSASVHHTIKGNIDLKHIIGIEAYSTRPLRDESVTVFGPPLHDQELHEGHDHGHDDDSCAPTHYEVRGISNLKLIIPTLSPDQLERLDEWIRSLLWESKLPDVAGEQQPLQVLRCKGQIVTTDGGLHVLQGVRSLYEMTEVEDAGLGVPDQGKIVLIGKGLNSSVRENLALFLGLDVQT